MKLRIFAILVLLSASPAFAGEFGLRFGYWDIQEGSFNLDLQQRIIADDALVGSGSNSYAPGTAFGDFRSDASFTHPFMLYYGPAGWPAGIRFETEYYGTKRSHWRGEGFSLTSLSQAEIEGFRERAAFRLAIFFLDTRQNAPIDLILRGGVLYNHQFSSEEIYTYNSTGIQSVTNYIGNRDIKMFMPTVGLEVKVPLARSGFSLIGAVDFSQKGSESLDYVRTTYAPSGTTLTTTAENMKADVNVIRNMYEAGLVYNVTKDFMLRLTYRSEVDLVSYSGYRGLNGTFVTTPSSQSFTVNLAESLLDAASAYNGRKKERVEGIYFGIEKFFEFR
ncbi:MAG TPA: hypothetical protein DEA96_02885 [Leptospiraceae bacterium]|nr:hypothetical protein [Spirochaetaceae bacterium]HBS03883.1 hypothetical protein [Leptospiraceae bacterium]|tara:strand:+ start:54057 stop:55058 length:1002 start_codon:yes stop_codon:yes gene_type:complete